MAQLGENGKGLTDAVDQLGRILSGVLRAAFLASAVAPERARAARILGQFDNAARKAQVATKRVSTTDKFNIHASRTPERQRLLNRLPTTEQFSDLRKYFAAKAALLSVNQNIGGQIVRHAAGEGASIPAKQSRPSAAAPSA